MEAEFWAGKVVSRRGYSAVQCHEKRLKGRGKHGGTERSDSCFNTECALVFICSALNAVGILCVWKHGIIILVLVCILLCVLHGQWWKI